VTQDVSVNNAAVLTIDPGVQVRFHPDCALSVMDGVLVARGNEASNIHFTAHFVPPESNRWANIYFSPNAVDASFDMNGNWTNGCVLDHVTVDFAKQSGGIYADNSSPFVADCVVRSNNCAGIYGNGSHGMRIRGNAIHDNTGHGVFFVSANDLIIQSNEVCRNTPHGVRLNACDRANASQNVIWDNANWGIYFYESSDDGVLTNNWICANHGEGVYLYRATGLYAEGNVCSSNGHSGIFLDESSFGVVCGTVCGNELSGNSQYGLVLYNADNVTAYSNTISANRLQGLAIYTSTNFLGYANRICDNRSEGVKVWGIPSSVSRSIVLSADTNAPTEIYGNSGYDVYNNMYYVSDDPLGEGNIDARHVWWGTTDDSAIQDAIYDYEDTNSKGRVIYDPATFGLVLETRIHGDGIVDRVPDRSYYASNDVVALTASPADYWYFSSWSNAIVGTNTCTNVTLAGDAVVDAYFDAYLVTNETPIWWLVQYDLGTNDVAALDDPDGDRCPNWHEYHAGTIPTNGLSYLGISNITSVAESSVSIDWFSVSGKQYRVMIRTNLLTADWGIMTNGISGTPPLNTVTSTTSHSCGFYRIEIDD
jgi:parallel beta-helix repeat protein